MIIALVLVFIVVASVVSSKGMVELRARLMAEDAADAGLDYSGLDYCVTHHGVRDVDQDVCDFADGDGDACVLIPLRYVVPQPWTDVER